ncbi:hypothetical protein IscW_ISCW011708 [Ixodes scapularis]|uniref:Uncharacterized protein n=1 Tax=Ixodes scapularis TaxID=6945 RepID=B7Q549_IXOSC|nr:hypothetical protein IscW_ISCW011708 [Ixodes scapularis]|eukprot:XP_002411685.1 hypothetical protein IscW_ISCW011708 [Ixodes scapularis]
MCFYVSGGKNSAAARERGCGSKCSIVFFPKRLKRSIIFFFYHFLYALANKNDCPSYGFQPHLVTLLLCEQSRKERFCVTDCIRRLESVGACKGTEVLRTKG